MKKVSYNSFYSRLKKLYLENFNLVASLFGFKEEIENVGNKLVIGSGMEYYLFDPI
jgi:hypothetical protein